MDKNEVLKKVYPLLKIIFEKIHEEKILALLQMTEVGSIEEIPSTDPNLIHCKISISENQSQEILAELQKLSLDLFSESIFQTAEIVWEEIGDWADKYQEHLQVFKFIQTAQHSIFIDPRGIPTKNKDTLFIKASLAFGTGTHPTTQLVAEALTQLTESTEPSPDLLDIGCGTAILSMLGEKLGIPQIIAVDNDPQALEMAQENLNINHMKHIQLHHDLFQIKEKFSLIVANILLETLVLLHDAILQRLQPNAYLILSGLLKEDEEEILKTYSDLTFIQKTQREEWVCLVFKK